MKGMSYGQSPALVAISMKAAISALQGNVMPQLISIPIPVATYKDLKPGTNFWPDLTTSFFAPNQFTPCEVNFTAPEIMAQSEKNTQ
jgi:ribose transport system substrate-binding protein